MQFKTRLLLIPGLLAMLAGTPGMMAPASADIPGEHPHYVHALSELRHARWLLNHPEEWNVQREEGAATRDINNAINSITQAAIDDGKNTSLTFPEDANLDYRGRLRQARALLDAAQNDLSYREDNPGAEGWREAAQRSIGYAHRHVDNAMRAQHWDRE